jgi:rSAM/selenodomain-associated transferase 1
MTKKTKNGLIIFAKFPQEGKVKTRLAERIGNKKATQFYKLFAENLFDHAAKLSFTNTYLFFDPSSTKEKMKEWIKFDFEYYPQNNLDLGKRMAEAFNKLFGRRVKKAVIVGTDVPDMNKKIIEQAFDLLDKHDLVISPSPDGGYNLLGMKKLHLNLFENIEWSSSTVLKKTVDAAKKQNLTIKLLDQLIDIDTEKELLEWLAISNKGNENLKNEIKKIITDIN